jgi:hypothetical protein
MPCELRALAVFDETHVPWPAEPSRVPGGPTPAVRNMGEQMFPIIDERLVWRCGDADLRAAGG